MSLIASETRHAPRFLSQLHPKFNTPVNAIVLQSSLSVIFVLIGNFTALVTFYSIIAWTFYFGAVMALLVLRRNEPLMHRPFKVWTVVPILFCLCTVFLLVCGIKQEPWIALAGYLFLFSGVGVWYVVIYRENAWEGIY